MRPILYTVSFFIILLLNELFLAALLSSYLGTQSVESALDVLIATVNLGYVVDAACALGTHSGNEQSDTGTYVGACHSAGAQLSFAVVSHDDASVWVAQNDLCTHVNEFVDEEQTALEHLLMYKYRAASLSSHHDEHRQEVRSKSRPRSIGQSEDSTVDE